MDVSDILIRTATLQDARIIHSFIEQNKFQKDGKGSLLSVSYEEIEKRVSDGDFFLGIINENIVGCISLIEYDGIAEIRSFIVLPEFRGRGIGKALLDACILEAKKHDYDKIYALTHESVFGFFEKNGFVKVEVPEQKLEKDCAKCPLFGNGCN